MRSRYRPTSWQSPEPGSLAHPEQNITARTLELTAEDLADLG
jgi:hypothetical protein